MKTLNVFYHWANITTPKHMLYGSHHFMKYADMLMGLPLNHY